MISLKGLAQQYGAQTVDRDGFDLEGHELITSIERAIRRKLGGWLRVIASLGPNCPNIYSGELRSAKYAAKLAEDDLRELVSLRSERAA